MQPDLFMDAASGTEPVMSQNNRPHQDFLAATELRDVPRISLCARLGDRGCAIPWSLVSRH